MSLALGERPQHSRSSQKRQKDHSRRDADRGKLLCQKICLGGDSLFGDNIHNRPVMYSQGTVICIPTASKLFIEDHAGFSCLYICFRPGEVCTLPDLRILQDPEEVIVIHALIMQNQTAVRVYDVGIAFPAVALYAQHFLKL